MRNYLINFLYRSSIGNKKSRNNLNTQFVENDKLGIQWETLKDTFEIHLEVRHNIAE